MMNLIGSGQMRYCQQCSKGDGHSVYHMGDCPNGPKVDTTASKYPFSQAQQGWECPRCKSINAPFMPKCDCKSHE